MEDQNVKSGMAQMVVSPDVAGNPFLNRPDHMLVVGQVWHLFMNGLGKDFRRGRTAQMKLAKLRGSVGKGDLFADKVFVEVLDHFGSGANREVQPKGVAPIPQNEMVNMPKRNIAGGSVGEENLAPISHRQGFDFIAAQVVQKRSGVRSGQLDFGPGTPVHQQRLIPGPILPPGFIRVGLDKRESQRFDQGKSPIPCMLTDYFEIAHELVSD